MTTATTTSSRRLHVTVRLKHQFRCCRPAQVSYNEKDDINQPKLNYFGETKNRNKNENNYLVSTLLRTAHAHHLVTK